MTVFHIHFPVRTVMLAASEAMLVTATFATAVYARFGSDAELMLTDAQLSANMLVAPVACMVSMYYFDLYQSVVLRSLIENLTRLVQVIGAASIVLGLFYLAVPIARVDQELFFLWAAMAGVTLAAWRIAFYKIVRVLRFRNRVVFVGGGPLRSTVISELVRRPELGVHIVGYVADAEDRTCGAQYLGDLAALPALRSQQRIEQMIVGGNHALIRELETVAPGLPSESAESVYEAVFDKVALETMDSDVFFLHGGPTQLTLITSRFLSAVTAGIGLLVAAPVMLLTAIAIYIDSPGPVIFRQKRVGRGGKEFTLYKFRSMVIDADKDGFARPAERNDSRFTRLGRFIRRTRLDELPQLFNVLRGDMCLVGPRPFTVNMEQELAAQIPGYSKRWLVRPGITGWAQVRRAYCVSLEDNVDKLRYDLFYIKHQSVGLDMVVWCETMKNVLLGRGAQ